ncbi:hypothetical protein CH368_08475 [Leptospira levettii]|nr:hypothetical protein CH368_08475 [Leptospira levettii]
MIQFRYFSYLIIFLLFFNCANNVSFVVTPANLSKNSANGKVLSIDKPQICQNPSIIKHWSVLYGIVPISDFSTERIFPNPNSVYLVREEFTFSDKIYSLILGVSASVIRKSWIVDECKLINADDSSFSSKEKEYQVIFQATLLKNKDNFKLNELLPTIWFRNGEIIQADLVDQNLDTIKIKHSNGESQVIARSDILFINFPKEDSK